LYQQDSKKEKFLLLTGKIKRGKDVPNKNVKNLFLLRRQAELRRCVGRCTMPQTRHFSLLEIPPSKWFGLSDTIYMD